MTSVSLAHSEGVNGTVDNLHTRNLAYCVAVVSQIKSATATTKKAVLTNGS